MIDERDREAIKLLVIDTVSKEMKRLEQQKAQEAEKGEEKSSMEAALEKILEKYEG